MSTGSWSGYSAGTSPSIQRKAVLILFRPRNATTGPAVVRSCSQQRGPPMLIGGSEALGGMQISPALLRYPSVPLPVLFNPLIPPDWRKEEENTAAGLLPPSRGPRLCRGKGVRGAWLGTGLSGPCHVLYIRGDQQASLKVRWHQPHAQRSPTPPHPSSFLLLSLTFPIISYFHFSPLLPAAPSPLLFTPLLGLSHLSLKPPKIHTVQPPVSPPVRSEKATCWMLVIIKTGWERERHEKKGGGVLVGAVWVRDQSRPGTRKMFRLGWRACQNHQALAFDEDLLVQDLRVTWHSEGVRISLSSLFICSSIFGFMQNFSVWRKTNYSTSAEIWNINVINFFVRELIFCIVQKPNRKIPFYVCVCVEGTRVMLKFWNVQV